MAKAKSYLPLLSIAAGIVVLLAPQILAWVIGIYLIVWGVAEWKS